MKKGDRLTVTIESLAFGGPGIARVDAGLDSSGKPRKMVIFVEGVAPGDEVEIELFSLRRNLVLGRVKRFLKLSPTRVEARCPHFGPKINTEGVPLPFQISGEAVAEAISPYQMESSSNCGGCSWQFLSYDDQLKIKETEVRSALNRIGDIPSELLDSVWKPIMAATSPWYYRNKMDFSFVSDRFDNKWHLGLHMKGRFREVTEVRECYLFRPWIGKFLEILRPFFENLELGEEGELKSLIVRCGTNTGEVMVNLQVENAETEWSEEFKNLVIGFFEKLPITKLQAGVSEDKLVSIFLTSIINKKGQRKQFNETLIFGAPVFNETLKIGQEHELNFEVAPQAFLQPNTKQAERFYSLVGELAELTGKENVFDVFCGTGTIGMTLAAKARRVVGLELNAPAVENARKNAELNGVKNMEFVVGDATKILPEIVASPDYQPNVGDLVVVDPPRAGLHADVIATIANTAAKKVIYVSCNPSTLARDLKIFRAAGFELNFVQAVDQFSQTYHVETVTRLVRK